MKLISKHFGECLFCGEEHDIEVYENLATEEIKGVKVTYFEEIHRCSVDDEYFYPKKIINKNLLAAIDTYKKEKNLLTSREIMEIRKNYKLTQEEFSRILGLGDITINRYETKLIQDETYDEKMREFSENPLYALEELEKHRLNFNEERYNEIKKMILLEIEKNGIYFFKRQTIKSLYANYEDTSILNGFTKLQLKKIETIIKYLANNIDNLYKVKVLKLLWYIDFLSFKRNNRSLTGLVYKHFPLGAVPIGYDELLTAFPGINITMIEFEGDKVGYKIETSEKADLGIFVPTEIKIIIDVIEKFKNFGSGQIKEYMHKEVAYQKTLDYDYISYEYAKDLKEF